MPQEVKKNIAVVAAFDTKGAEVQFIADVIRQRGHYPLLIDVGVMSDPPIAADAPAGDVARAGGIELAVLRSSENKALAMQTMTHGASIVATELYGKKRFDAMIGIGDSAGTASLLGRASLIFIYLVDSC